MVLSPAKALDFDSPLPTSKHSQPRLLKQTQPLATAMSRVGTTEIAKMMSLSPQLADLNAERFTSWQIEHSAANSRPALCAFDGDVYKALDAASFGARDFTWAQARLRILSGLYGLLRPLDLIQPYRLEMGTSIQKLGFSTTAGTVNSLPQYWRSSVFDLLSRDICNDLPSNETKVLLNLASPEYAAALDPARLTDEAGVKTITPKFLDLVRGNYKVVGFFAKRARGAMAGWVVRQRAKTAKSLAAFDGLGYRHDPDQSSAGQPVFVRDEPPAPGSASNVGAA